MTPTPLLSEKEAQILDAAQKRFSQYGLTKVTMDEIAADLGMGKASLYYYFPTKEDLFRSVVRREQQRFKERIHALMKQKIPASGKLRQYSEHRNQYYAELMDCKLLGNTFLQNTKPIIGELFTSFADEELAMLKEILLDGQTKGEFQFESFPETAELLLHTLQGLRIRYVKHMLLQDSSEINFSLERETRLFIDLFLRGIATPYSSESTQ